MSRLLDYAARRVTENRAGVVARLGNAANSSPTAPSSGRSGGKLASTQAAVMSGGTDVGQDPTWNGESAIRNGYYGSIWAMRGIQTIADTVASLPWTAGPDPLDPATVAVDDPLAKLLGPATTMHPGGPNSAMSARALWSYSIVQYLCTGKWGWELQMDTPTGTIAGLWPLVSYLLKPRPVYGQAQLFGDFDYNLPSGKVVMPAGRVFYAWKMSATDPRDPESVLQAAGLPLSISVAIDRQMWALIKNGMVAPHIVTTLPIEESNARRAWEEQFLAQFTGFDQAGKPIFNYAEPDDNGKVSDTIDIKSVATTPKDAMVEWLAGWSRDAVLTAIGTPESLLGNASQRIYANADSEYRNFWTLRVLGVIAEVQDAVNTWLSPRIGPNVGWFDLSRVVALQPPQAFAPPAMKDMIDAGVLTVTEAQSLLGLESTGKMDSITAPIGEEDSLTGAGSMTRSDTSVRMEARSIRFPDGSTRALPRGWRCQRTPANVMTIRNGTAWDWEIATPNPERITVSTLVEQRTPETAVASSVPKPFGSPSGPGLWHHKGWELPPYIQHVAHALVKQGKSESEAISMAVGVVRKWAAGGGGVHADVQAAAAKNIAAWEALKAAAGAAGKK